MTGILKKRFAFCSASKAHLRSWKRSLGGKYLKFVLSKSDSATDNVELQWTDRLDECKLFGETEVQ